MTRNELYELRDSVVCALTHDISVCGGCKKCGEYGPAVRINLMHKVEDLIEALAKTIDEGTVSVK